MLGECSCCYGGPDRSRPGQACLPLQFCLTWLRQPGTPPAGVPRCATTQAPAPLPAPLLPQGSAPPHYAQLTWQSIRLCHSTTFGSTPRPSMSANAAAARSAYWAGRS